MENILKLFPFIKRYWKRSSVALVLLTSLVFLDLSIPRLIQRIIDQGITAHNQQVVIQTALLMIGISLVSTLIAVGNNILSVQVGESIARDLRDALFTRIQAFSYGNLDEQKTGQLMVRLTSDTTAVQRVAQISLRIGTRAPLLMIGSLILMVNTNLNLALRWSHYSNRYSKNSTGSIPFCRKTLPGHGWSKPSCAPISKANASRARTKPTQITPCGSCRSCRACRRC
jgi:ATP-binding cassette subfamily B multidrug efflux pump